MTTRAFCFTAISSAACITCRTSATDFVSKFKLSGGDKSRVEEEVKAVV